MRCGFTTGACAAAVAKLAWLRSANALISFSKDSLTVRFPDGKDRQMPLLAEKGENSFAKDHIANHQAVIRKDAGDDPDCTDGIIMYADIRSAELSEIRSEDYLLSVGEGKVVLRAVEGIGLCTRSGLDCDQGRWAINPVPRQMITENLSLAGLSSGIWLLEIGIVNGAAIATHTLNAQLGILGGLSVLGTTGIVHPYSNEAWIDTIRLCVRSIVKNNAKATANIEKTASIQSSTLSSILSSETVRKTAQDSALKVVFCTGNRTLRGAMQYLPHLPQENFILMGDFLAESLSLASQYGIQDIVLACMPGKLCKYAQGLGNTHAHHAKQDLQPLMETAQSVLATMPNSSVSATSDFFSIPALPSNVSPALLSDLPSKLAECSSMREAMDILPQEVRFEILRQLAKKALQKIPLGFFHVSLLLFDFNGDFLLSQERKTQGACYARSNKSIE